MGKRKGLFLWRSKGRNSNDLRLEIFPILSRLRMDGVVLISSWVLFMLNIKELEQLILTKVENTFSESNKVMKFQMILLILP